MIVVDASAFAAVLFEEDEAEDVAHRLHGERLVAPSLLTYEVANVCLTKCRRHPENRQDLIRRLERGLRFAIEELPIDPKAAFALAFETKLSIYDASYLYLALALEADLVTLDKALQRAWIAETGRSA